GSGTIILRSSESSGTGGIDDSGDHRLTAGTVTLTDDTSSGTGKGTGDIGSCAHPILLAASTVTGNNNANVFITDNSAATISGSNAANSSTGTYSFVDTAAPVTPSATISFASGSTLSANTVVLNASGSNGQVNLANSSITASTVEIGSDASITSSGINSL